MYSFILIYNVTGSKSLYFNISVIISMIMSKMIIIKTQLYYNEGTV